MTINDSLRMFNGSASCGGDGECFLGGLIRGGESAAFSFTCPPKRRNAHLSTSRLKLFEQCPAAYEHRYIRKTESGPKAEAPELGTLVHAVLEDLFDWVIRAEHVGVLPEEHVLERYRILWKEYNLTGLDIYQEGANMLREFVRRHPPVDHFKILAVEQELNVRMGEFLVNGFMDRVDKIDDETIKIVDYKTNRVLFTREEVDTDLQMSIYGIAAKEIWPWAKRFEFEFHMLRHNTVISTRRTSEQLADATDYVLALGRETEERTEFPATINPNCGYCDYRMKCYAYLNALEGRIEKVAFKKDDLATVAQAREQAHRLAKIFYARKKELEDILRAKLEHVEELVVPEAKMRYRFLTVAESTVYPVDKTLSLVAKYSGLSTGEVAERVLCVDNKKLESLCAELKETRKGNAQVLSVELDGIAQQTMAPRFDARAIKEDKKVLKRPKAECASLPQEASEAPKAPP